MKTHLAAKNAESAKTGEEPTGFGLRRRSNAESPLWISKAYRRFQILTDFQNQSGDSADFVTAVQDADAAKHAPIDPHSPCSLRSLWLNQQGRINHEERSAAKPQPKEENHRWTQMDTDRRATKNAEIAEIPGFPFLPSRRSLAAIKWIASREQSGRWQCKEQNVINGAWSAVPSFLCSLRSLWLLPFPDPATKNTESTESRTETDPALNSQLKSLSTPFAISAAKSLFVFSLFFAVTTAHAQWQTQSITLKPGWNAVYLHVDASHVTLDASVGADTANPITEVWLWKPKMSPDRFINNPQQPVSGDDWGSWNRSTTVADTFTSLIGNAAYLVKNGGNADYTWTIKGKPVPPHYDWTSKGVNLIGFATPANNPPLFSTFLTPVQRLASGGEFYRYDDGNNDLTPSLFNALFNSVRVNRGQAYWIRHAGEFNRYFGAFEIALQNSSGIQFGASGSQHSLRVRNITAGDITLTLALVASEAAPSGQTAIAGTPPLLLRGALNSANLTYGSTALSSGSQTVTLKARGQVGSEAELVLGVNRVAMTGNASDLFAGILRLTDSLGYTQIDLPVTANPASSSGLWVGNALVNQVRHYLKNYQRDTSGKPAQNSSGQYVVASSVTSLGSVARPFNLRLIVHKSAAEARLLQRAYHGTGLANNTVVTTRENLLLPASLSSARRISAVHLPFSDGNAGWAFTGQFAQGQSMSAQVNLAFGDYASNPFLHSFHPDHDNLNALFSATEVRGAESYDIERKVTLTFTAPGSDFASLVSGGNQMTGQYAEEIVLKGRGAESRQIDTAGVFVLKRISEIATLTTQ